jgi:endonuclease/exonuclease/phosphatase family metal-dependent hydrolase
LVVLIGIAVFAAQHDNKPADSGATLAGNNTAIHPVQTFDYGDATTPENSTPSEAGSKTDSGTGVVIGSHNVRKPGTPGGVSLTPDSYQISARWNGVSGATQYETQLARDNLMTNPRQITSGTSSLIIPGLSPDTHYYFRARAINSAGASAWSGVNSIKTKAVNPSVPQTPLPDKVGGVHIAVNASNTITVGWSSASHASRYSVTRASNSAMTTGRKEYAAPTGNSYKLSDLAAGTKYYFTVRASNNRGFGPSSSVVGGKTRVAATAVSSLSLYSNNNVKLVLRSETGVSGYQVRYSKNSNFSGAKTVTSKTKTVTITGLAQATKYYFSARSADGSYHSGWSKSVSVKTKVIPVPFWMSSFNVYYSSNDRDHEYSEVQYLTRLTRSANVIKKYKLQLVGLQEVRKNQYQHILDSARLGSGYGIFPKNYAAAGYAAQNPVVWNKSRFALVDSGSKVIPGPHVLGGWYASSNVQVELRDKETGQLFFLINTHETVGTTAADAKSRYVSAKNRVAYLKTLAKKGLPIFMTGDYNSSDHMPQKQPVYQNNFQNTAYCLFTKNTVMRNSYNVLHGIAGCPQRNSLGVDHVYVSKGVQVQKYDYSSAQPRANGSDVHNTLMVKVKLPQ